MSEPAADASDQELAQHYEHGRERGAWGEPEPIGKPERLNVTISVRFSASEIAAVRSRAAAAGLKPTAYIRQCALSAEEPPLDRSRISRSVAALSVEIEDLRRAVG